MNSEAQKVEIRLLRKDEILPYRQLRIKTLETDPSAFHLDLESAKCKPDSFFGDEIFDSLFGCFGAFLGEQLVGMVTLKQVEPFLANLYTLYVLPEFRGRGIARALIQEAILVAKKQGITEISFTVMESNPAIALYEALNFRKVGAVSGSPNEFMYTGTVQDLKVI
jgi:ribosomal protein S18 acetylase RimI-like enzyme